MRTSIVTICVATVVFTAGCAAKKVRQADAVAKQGNWEEALAEYRVAAAEHPNDKKINERIQQASREVALLDVKKAETSNAAGKLGEAGDLWKQALDLTDDPTVRQSVTDSIGANASALEYYGDISSQFYSWQDAIGAYGALLIVRPNDVDLLERYRQAKREFAGDLNLASDELNRKDLAGAALVASLRALQNDPMQSGAFDRVANLRRTIAGRSKVALNEVKIEDKGYHGLGLALSPKLTRKIADYPPYGPTKDPEAVPAVFVVTIDSFDKSETEAKGEDVLPNEIPPSKEPVPNPAVAEQQKKIEKLVADLGGMQSDLKKLMPPKSAQRPTPSTHKKALAPDAEAKRLAGLDLARKIDAKRKDIAAAKTELAALPLTVPPPAPPATWTLPWTDVTRTVTAKVKFEIDEKDGDGPVVIELTKSVTHKDRTHKGNEKQGMLPDPLELPTFDVMYNELAEQFQDGAQVIGQARSRRVERLLAEARTKKQMGDDDASLNAFVESLFILGPDGLPKDAQIQLAKDTDNEQLKEILGAQPDQKAQPVSAGGTTNGSK